MGWTSVIAQLAWPSPDPTFQRILLSAREKVADSLLHGKAIRIEGRRVCAYRAGSGILPALWPFLGIAGGGRRSNYRRHFGGGCFRMTRQADLLLRQA